jgi:hypothetical protein
VAETDARERADAGKGVVAIPPSQPFPKPYSGACRLLPVAPNGLPYQRWPPLPDNFDAYPVDGIAKYLADDGGSFQVAASPDNDPTRGNVLKQWSRFDNGVNGWGTSTVPATGQPGSRRQWRRLSRRCHAIHSRPSPTLAARIGQPST